VKYDESRLAKLEALREKGVSPYAWGFAGAEPVAGRVAAFRDEADPPVRVRVAGRLTARRDFGKAFFGDLRDRSGKVQVYVKKNQVGEETFTLAGLLEISCWRSRCWACRRSGTGCGTWRRATGSATWISSATRRSPRSSASGT
jgi:hypothetical protein